MNATIEEGSQARNFGPVTKLKVALANSAGDSYWVPESAVELDSLATDKNGEFHAQDFGVYGWDSIHVNVDQSLNNGDDTDEDWPEDDYDDDDWITDDGPGTDDGIGGDDEWIYTDEDGNLVEEELPDHIEIVTLPLKLEYGDGESINISGIRVVPKKADGSTWTNSKYFRGYIPLNELIIEPTKADASQVTGGGASSDLQTGAISKPIPFGEELKINHRGGLQDVIPAAPGEAITGWLFQIAVYYYIRASKETFDGASSSTYYGKTVYYKATTVGTGAIDSMEPNAYPNGYYYSDGQAAPVAWTIIYGEITGGTQNITISWARPNDGELLSASFSIQIENSGAASASF